MKILLHYDCGPRLLRRIEALAAEDLHVSVCSESDDNRFATLMRDTEVLWHALRPVTADAIAAAPKLRLIQKIGVGLNTIDLEAARARGVAVANMPGTNSRAVAEMTLLLMLAALRRLPLLDGATRAGRGWVEGPALQERYGELGGRTVGLLGYGGVPRLLAPVLTALGATILYTAREPKQDAAGDWRPLDALLAEADILSLHAPLTEETAGLLDDAAFARMKPGSILVNTARGGLVDEAALVRALDDGPLAAAALDVFAEEPVPADNPLLRRDDVVVMPHLAWLTPETFDRSLVVAIENCRRLRAGEGLLNRAV